MTLAKLNIFQSLIYGFQEVGPTKKKLIVPPFLNPGDTIGIATPASPYKAEALREGIHLLKQWGFQVTLGRKGIGRKSYLAGTDRERAEEIMGLFSDPGIKAILCSRGGYGAMRILDFLDFKKIKDHPKLFMGFSDVTVLLMALWKKAGLMAFHGPMVTTLPQLIASVADQGTGDLDWDFIKFKSPWTPIGLFGREAPGVF